MTIDHEGRPLLERGFVKKEEQKNHAPKVAQQPPGTGASPENDEQAPEPVEYRQSLEKDLLAYRLAAAKTDLLYNTDEAFDLMLFSICWDTFAGENQTSSGCPTSWRSENANGSTVVGVWKGTCGTSWDLVGGSPSDNGMHYCSKCGSRIQATTR